MQHIHISRLCFEVVRQDSLIPKYKQGNRTRIPDAAEFSLGCTNYYDLENFCKFIDTLDTPWIVKRINVFVSDNHELSKSTCIWITSMLEGIRDSFEFEMEVYPMTQSMLNSFHGCGNGF